MITNAVLRVLLLLSATRLGIGQIRGRGNEILNSKQNTHLVRLKITDYGYQSYCSGAIIGDRWILTTAQCVQDIYEENKIIVEYRKGQKFYKLVDVADIFLKDQSYDEHFENSPENTEKDLALILTKYRIRFDDYVQPIKLATRSVDISMVKGDVSAVRYAYGEIKPGLYVPKQDVVQIVICPSSYKETSLICSDGAAIVNDLGSSLVYKGKLIGVLSEEVDSSSKSKRDDIPNNEGKAWETKSTLLEKGSETAESKSTTSEKGSETSGPKSTTSEKESDTSEKGSETKESKSTLTEKGSGTVGQECTEVESDSRNSRTFTVYVNVAANLDWIKYVTSIF